MWIFTKMIRQVNFWVFGFLSEINLQKFTDNSIHLFKPKMLLRYAPGSMRKEKSGERLNTYRAFRLDRISNINNYETGISGTLGLILKLKKIPKLNSIFL